MNAKTVRGRAFVDGAFAEAEITIAGGVITDVVTTGAPESIEIILPGFIDVHVHGGGGADFMDGTAEAVETVTRFHARHGTAALAATTLSASAGDISRAIAAATANHRHPLAGCAEIAGVHLEGPYISPNKSGAQDRASIRGADLRELEELIERAPHLPWMMTVAPEAEGVRALIERFHRQVLFSVGHTEATYAQTLEAVQLGARHFTHLFNAMPPFNHREPGPVGAAIVSLDSTVELIADGVHVHHMVLQTFARLLHDRAVLVTDAMRAAGMPEGNYKLYGYDATVADGAVRLANGALAGSVLTMMMAVQNMVELAGLPLEAVVPLATEIPARLLRLERRKGRIEVGFDADLVIFNPRFEIQRVFLRGEELDLA